MKIWALVFIIPFAIWAVAFLMGCADIVRNIKGEEDDAR